MSEVRTVRLCGEHFGVALLTISDADPWTLTLQFEDREYEASGLDLFDSLVILRRELEADGMLICVEGAQANVYPSGMSRQMGAGRGAYRHSIDGPDRTAPPELVDIFDPAGCMAAVTVEDQEIAIKELLRRD